MDPRHETSEADEFSLSFPCFHLFHTHIERSFFALSHLGYFFPLQTMPSLLTFTFLSLLLLLIRRLSLTVSALALASDSNLFLDFNNGDLSQDATTWSSFSSDPNSDQDLLASATLPYDIGSSDGTSVQPLADSYISADGASSSSSSTPLDDLSWDTSNLDLFSSSSISNSDSNNDFSLLDDGSASLLLAAGGDCSTSSDSLPPVKGKKSRRDDGSPVTCKSGDSYNNPNNNVDNILSLPSELFQPDSAIGTLEDVAGSGAGGGTSKKTSDLCTMYTDGTLPVGLCSTGLAMNEVRVNGLKIGGQQFVLKTVSPCEFGKFRPDRFSISHISHFIFRIITNNQSLFLSTNLRQHSL